MNETTSAAAAKASRPNGLRAKTIAIIRGMMEAVVLLLVFLSPWPFGSAHPPAEALIYAGVALLLALWGLRMLVEGRFTWERCPIALCLAGLVLIGLLQLVPIGQSVLAWASPGGAQLRAELLPAQRELLPGESEVSLPSAVISLYPGETRAEVVRLLAVFLLFVVVRNNLVSVAALRRLAVVALVDAVLLAVFAVVQFFSANGKLFWTFPTGGGGGAAFFGPFICRNHFPFFTNMGVGLGLGLLLAYWPARDRRQYGPGALLQNPTLLWLVAGLALAISGGLFSCSRGGFVALVAGCLCCLALYGRGGGRRALAAGAAAAVAILAFGLLVMFGLPRVETRLSSLWGADPVEEGRTATWLRVLPGTKDFPLFGAGYGTFALVEPLSRGPGDAPGLVWDHAHNEFVEALVDGGLAEFALTLLLVVLTFRLGLHALTRYQNGAGAGLIVGALAAFTTVVVHSFVDFGLHMPAIALLATVIAAYIAGLGAEAGRTAEAGLLSLRLGGLGGVLGASAVIALGVLLAASGRTMDASDRELRMAHKQSVIAGAAARDQQIEILQAEVARAPDNADSHLALADAYLQAHDERRPGNNDEKKYIIAALQQYRDARDLCPLQPTTYVRLASFVEYFQRADPRRLYLDRAKRLRPSDAELWYLVGEQELLDGQQEEAWRSWRRSLELSERRLPDVIKRLASLPDAADSLQKALPARAVYLHQAALALPSADADASDRKRLLEKTLELLPPPESRKPEDWQLEAATQLELGRKSEALAAYQIAVARDPQQTEWRFQFGRLLLEDGRLEEALKELRQVAREQPNNAEAVALYQTAFRRAAGAP